MTGIHNSSRNDTGHIFSPIVNDMNKMNQDSKTAC
jgi:hypothetical protein